MELRTKAIGLSVIAAVTLAACSGAFAASGCATVTEITSVNTRPMADIYRLDKRSVSTGGQIAMLLAAFTPLGAFASAATDVAVEVGGTAFRQNSVENDRRQELENQKWEGVFEVTYKPDFGEPLTITIRDSEMTRYRIEKGARVVMYDPSRDVEITTDNGKRVTRTRPSIQAPSNFWGAVHKVEVPTSDNNFSDDYKKFCFKDQAGPDYQTMSGPWNSDAYKRPYLTHFEILESGKVFGAIAEKIKARPQATAEDKDKALLDLLTLEITSLNFMVFARTIDEVSENRINLYKNRIPVITQQLLELKQKTGFISPLESEVTLNFIRESAQVRIQEFLNAKVKNNNLSAAIN